MAFEVFRGAGPFFGGVFEEHRAISGAEIDGGHLHAGAGEAEKILFPATESERGKAGGGTVILGELLIEAHVSLGIVVGKDGAHAAEKDGNALVAAGEAVIEI